MIQRYRYNNTSAVWIIDVGFSKLKTFLDLYTYVNRNIIIYCTHICTLLQYKRKRDKEKKSV